MSDRAVLAQWRLAGESLSLLSGIRCSQKNWGSMASGDSHRLYIENTNQNHTSQTIMMNWQSQLTQLIFDYYRENLGERQKLDILQHCRLSRRWRSLRIECQKLETALALREVGDLLRQPVAQLRLARNVRLFVNGQLMAVIPVYPSGVSPNLSDRAGDDADLLR
jgi:hypothetical protein